MPKNKGGKPPLYKTGEELKAKILEYFDNPPMVTIYRQGEPYQVPKATSSGLVLYLGYCDRNSFYDLEKHPRYSSAVKMARSMIEAYYEAHLTEGNPAGPIFALKNFGWRDTQHTETDLNINIVSKLPKPLKQAIPALEND